MVTIPTKYELLASGFDHDAVERILQALAALEQHVLTWVADDPDMHHIFEHEEGLYRQAIASYIDQAVREGSAVWITHLTNLANELDIFSDVLDAQFSSCHSNGYFDFWNKKQISRPKAETLRPQFDVVLEKYSTVQARVDAFRKTKLCRDHQTALNTANAFKRPLLERYAVSRVCAIIRAWACISFAGLLHLSKYRFAEELRLLEQYLQDRTPQERPSKETVAAVRRALLALCRAITTIHPPLWHRNLLFEPPNSSARQEYENHLLSFVLARIVAQLAALLEISPGESEEIYRCYMRRGFSGLFAYYDAEHAESIHQNVEYRHFLAMVQEQATTIVDSGWRQEIMRLADALYRALHESHVALSYVTIIKDRPSSRERISWGRRLSFGFPSLVRRKQGAASLSSTEIQSEKVLTSRFAQWGLLGEDDATNRLRNIVSRGVMGFAPQEFWAELFDGRLVAWITLIKFGRPPYAVPWSEIYRFATNYASELGIMAPAPQLLEAFYRSISVPDYWFGGKGLAMIRVHQEGKRTITDRPRLHAKWLIKVIELKLPVLDEVAVTLTKKSYLVLVADDETELPMGVRLCAGPPNGQDVLLAMYQTIWRPGPASWPTHGAPGIFRVAAPLLGNRVADLERAAGYLLAKVETPDKVSLSGKQRLQQMVADVQRDGPTYVQQYKKSEPISAVQAERLLLEYLQKTFLPHHRGVKASLFHDAGVAIAGHDTPAAGWLLPYADGGASIIVSERGVLIDGQRYSSPYLQPLVGSACRYRRYPMYYPGRDEGVFIEVAREDGRVMLHYLARRG